MGKESMAIQPIARDAEKIDLTHLLVEHPRRADLRAGPGVRGRDVQQSLRRRF